MGSNIRDFHLGLEKYKNDIPENVRKVHRAVSLEALKGVVRMSPVDTGRLRANWQVSNGSPATGDLDATDKRGGATIAKGSTANASAEPYTETFITNNLPYSEFIENGGSDQAPQGMLNVTFNRLRAWLARQR